MNTIIIRYKYYINSRIYEHHKTSQSSDLFSTKKPTSNKEWSLLRKQLLPAKIKVSVQSKKEI